MADSPTIVSASLDDKELKASIDKMVSNFNEGLNTMKKSATDAVSDIQKTLQKLGDIKVDSGGSADGGSSKRAKAQNAETAAVEKSITARDKQIKKNQETAMSFDQIAAAQQKAVQSQGDSTLKKSFNRQELQQYIDRLRELQAEYIKVNTQQGGGVKSDKIKTDIRNLEELIAKYREILNNLDYVNSRQGTIDVKKWVQDLGAVDDRYKKLVRWYTVLEKEDQRRIASEEKANQKRLADLEKEKAAQDKVIKSYQDSVLKAEFGKVMKMPTTNIDEIRAKLERLSSIIANIRELGILSPEKIAAADSEVKNLGASIQRYEKFEQERIAAEQKFVIEQAKEIEQTQTLEGRVKGLAQAAREYFKANNDNRLSMSAYGKGFTVYAEGDVRARGLSIEEQITRQLQTEKEMILAQVDGAKKLNEERKKTTTDGYDIYGATRAKIASKLGIKQDEVISADASTDSIKRVSSALKQLQDAYTKMDASERNSPIGQHMIRQMQELERQTQQLRKQMTRPISLKDALGGSEKTLDDIAYKIRQLQAYKMGINLTSPQAASEIKQIDNAIKELKKDMDKYMITSREVNNMNNALARSFNYMKNRLAFYFTVGASQQFVKTLMEIRSQYEMNERALGILINSAEKGSKVFQELSNMALVSPYTLIELSTAAKQLTAYDIAARDVVDTTRRLADMAAAVGIPIERLTYALGQIKAYGYLNARDARMFSNAGIPLVKQLSEYYSELEGKLVSTADIYDRIKKKAIGYNEVMQVVGKMTDEGGKFFDFQSKMAGTLKVQLANLTLAWNNMLNDIGKSEQGMISGTLGLLKNAFLQWKNLNRIIEDLAITFGILKTAHLVYYGVVLGTNKAIAAQAVLGTRLTGILKLLGSTMNQILTSGTTWWGLLAMAVSGAVISIVRGNEAMKEFNKSLRDDAKTTYEDLEKFSGQYSDLRKSLYKDGMPQDIDKNEAKKAWEVIREQIELSSNASSVFVGKLMNIENVSERLRQGFKIIDDIQAVAAAVKELGDNGVKLEKDWSEWWNLWTFPDGTIENLKDAHTWLSKINEEFGDLKSAKALSNLDVLTTEDGRTVKNLFKSRAEGYIENYENELEKFRKDLSATTRSVIDFIELKGWSNDTTKIEETFSRIFQKLALSNNLSPKEAMTLRLESAKAEYKALENALITHLNDESAAFDKARSENEKEEIKSRWNVYKSELNFLRSNTAQSRIYWEDFTKWMGEQHKSEVQAMFREQSAEQIKMLDFSRGEYNKWATDLAKKYAKEHGMSYKEVYDQLHNYILNANQWSIRIPLIITTEDTKSEIQTLKDADTAVDTAVANIERLKKRQKELEDSGASRVKSIKDQTKAEKELLKVDEEIASNEKDLAAARAKGGHGKKEDAKARKAQAAAEKEVTEALKNELSILKEMQSNYDKMRKAGIDNTTAIDLASQGYEKTLKRVNRTLAKYGISKFNANDFLGKDVNTVLRKLEQQRGDALASGKLKTGTLESLDVEIQKLKVEAKVYNFDKITKVLNNELGKLKEEYELAVELDANPELGGMFADYFGINLEELPKDYEQALKLAQKRINTMLKNSPDVGIASIDIEKLMSRSEFDAWVSSLGKDANSDLIKGISDVRSFLYKVRSDETKKQIQEWDKLLEKYAEYEHKVAQIQKEAEREREIARKKGASQDILDAINNREKQNLAQLSFEEFQKSPEWIVATGELANMSRSALGMLIDKIQEYRKTAKNLSPKQIKQINQALRQLYKEQRQGNPFGYISNMLDRAKDKMDVFNEEIADVEEQIRSAEDAVNAAYEAGEDASKPLKKLSELKKAWKKLKEEQKESGEIDANAWVGALNETIGAVNAAIGVFDDLAKAIGGVNGSDVDKVFSVLESAGSAAAIGAQIGGAWGAVIGGVVGAATSLISIFAGAANERITAKVEESERAVKRLELAYIDLEHAVQQAYGMATMGANMAAKANKELQLVELKRQLALERSRDSKDRDEDKIIDLQKQIKELEYDIADTVDSIVNDLLGISSVGDALENVMGNIIDTFREGGYKLKDIMKDVKISFNDMIANMVMKMYTTRVLQPWFEEQWNKIQDQINEHAGEIPNKLAEVQSKVSVAKMADLNDDNSLIEALRALGMNDVQIGSLLWFDEFGQYGHGAGRNARLRAAYEKLLKEAEQKEAEIQKELATATMPTTDDIKKYAELLRSGQPIVTDQLKEIESFLRELGLLNDKKKTTLSALQAGISGITENTAGALEAYMNGVSQQVYLHSDLLTQIRDAVVGMDMDVQVATQAQMLLQLQQSYAVQMAIQGILEGWNNPSGQAVRVELVS